MKIDLMRKALIGSAFSLVAIGALLFSVDPHYTTEIKNLPQEDLEVVGDCEGASIYAYADADRYVRFFRKPYGFNIDGGYDIFVSVSPERIEMFYFISDLLQRRTYMKLPKDTEVDRYDVLRVVERGLGYRKVPLNFRHCESDLVPSV